MLGKKMLARLGYHAMRSQMRMNMRSVCTATSHAALEHVRLREELEGIKQRMKALEQANPELRAAEDRGCYALRTCSTCGSHFLPKAHGRISYVTGSAFSPPKLHHINVVSQDVGELLRFYRDVMKMDEMPIEMFPRNQQTATGAGSNVPINFTTDGHMQMHLATQDLGVAFRSGEAINPIGVGPIGHIAYRTDDIVAFKRHLDAHSIHYADYGTRFARDWHQIFFLDPVGTIVEVHAVIPS